MARRACVLTSLVVLLSSGSASAQTTAAAPASEPPVELAKFLAGAAIALGLHEAGHVTADLLFGAKPGLRKVSFAGIPFFAITHPPVSSGREFVISSAGFWVQEASNELLLTRRPRIRHERAPLMKGLFAFNTLASVAYAGAAFTRAGPGERDTRGMAAAARVEEPWVGGVILAPALLDIARYYRPEARWLRWSSRGAKVAGAVLAIKAVQ